MFGMKKLEDGFRYASEMVTAGASDKEVGKKLVDSVLSFGRTNLIAGWAVATVGAAAGITTSILGPKLVKKIKERK